MGVIRGSSYYTIVDGTSWDNAQANAKRLGGNLVTINTAEENTWLHETFNINPKPDSIASPLREPTWL